MARHLTRLRRGLEEALDLGLTDASNLQLLQPKSPAISMTAAMQFSMGIRSGTRFFPCELTMRTLCLRP